MPSGVVTRRRAMAMALPSAAAAAWDASWSDCSGPYEDGWSGLEDYWRESDLYKDLMRAAGDGRLPDVLRLLDEGANPYPAPHDFHLSGAYRFPRPDAGAGPDGPDDPDDCAAVAQSVLGAAAFGGHVDVLRALLGRGEPDADALDEALDLAIAGGHAGAAAMLAEHGGVAGRAARRGAMRLLLGLADGDE